MSIRIGTSKTITGFDSGTLWIYQNHSTLDKKAIQKLRAKGYLFPSYGIDSLKAVSILFLIFLNIAIRAVTFSDMQDFERTIQMVRKEERTTQFYDT